MEIEPPTLKSLPGWPELVSVTLAGATGVKRNLLPLAELTRSDAVVVMRTVCRLAPATLRIAGTAAPVQVRPVGQLRTPAIEIETVLVPTGLVRMTSPKFRWRFTENSSGFTTLALTRTVVVAACAWPSGTAPKRASAVSREMKRVATIAAQNWIQPAPVTGRGEKAVNHGLPASTPPGLTRVLGNAP